MSRIECMKEILLEPGEGFSVVITNEGRVILRIGEVQTSPKNLSSDINKDEEKSITELSRVQQRTEEEYEGDYKGEKLGLVKMGKSEINKLESLLGVSCLKYWIISLNEFGENEPKKFQKYKCHRACIQNWNRIRLEKGMVFSHIHPSGPGYYYRREIESLKPEQLKIR